MSRALSAGARKAFLFFAAFLASATVAASVRSMSEKPALSDNLILFEKPAVSEEQPAISERRTSVATATEDVLPAVDRSASLVPNTEMAVWTKAPAFTTEHEVEIPYISYGRAGYHGHKSRTTGGENANTGDLTATHPALPLGTRARVTNLFTGKSVTVRINDRGPIVRGRIVDLSYSAAEQLGIVGSGVAHVRLEVVE
jgi:rare lipoprotein A